MREVGAVFVNKIIWKLDEVGWRRGGGIYLLLKNGMQLMSGQSSFILSVNSFCWGSVIGYGMER
jgi:hypothetical protein